jgi:hypothetical protein
MHEQFFEYETSIWMQIFDKYSVIRRFILNYNNQNLKYIYLFHLVNDLNKEKHIKFIRNVIKMSIKELAA